MHWYCTTRPIGHAHLGGRQVAAADLIDARFEIGRPIAVRDVVHALSAGELHVLAQMRMVVEEPFRELPHPAVSAIGDADAHLGIEEQDAVLDRVEQRLQLAQRAVGRLARVAQVVLAPAQVGHVGIDDEHAARGNRADLDQDDAAVEQAALLRLGARLERRLDRDADERVDIAGAVVAALREEAQYHRLSDVPGRQSEGGTMRSVPKRALHTTSLDSASNTAKPWPRRSSAGSHSLAAEACAGASPVACSTIMLPSVPSPGPRTTRRSGTLILWAAANEIDP